MCQGKAVGKVILSGEHAVVYGIPAIAIPVFDFQAKTTISNISNEFLKIIIHTPQLENKYSELDNFNINENNSPIEKTIINFFNKYSLSLKRSINLDIFSEIPISSGMGSGAAITTSILKSLAKYFKINIENDELFDFVMEIEKIYHGNPSGIDPKVIISEKPIYFIKNKCFNELELKAKFAMSIINSDLKSSTKDVVNWVGTQWKQNKIEYEKIFNEIGTITDNVKECLENNNIDDLGLLINENHFLLQKMGVSNSILDEIVDKSLKSGALGSKLSGAGWGGIIISILKPDNVEKYLLNMKNLGFEDIKITYY